MSERAIDVIRLGFEPKTHSLEGCCSIQLSYRTSPYFVSEADAKISSFFILKKFIFVFLHYNRKWII